MTVRLFGEVSINGLVMAFYNCSQDIRRSKSRELEALFFPSFCSERAHLPAQIRSGVDECVVIYHSAGSFLKEGRELPHCSFDSLP